MNSAKKYRKTIEWGKLEICLRKIRDIKGTYLARLGTVKDQNIKCLTGAEESKNRWQEYTELYKKDLQDQDKHDHSPRARYPRM